jgi:hypothetical protein
MSLGNIVRLEHSVFRTKPTGRLQVPGRSGLSVMARENDVRVAIEM